MREDFEFNEVAIALSASLGVPVDAKPQRRVAGGSINACFLWRGGAGPLFVKVGASRELAAFEAEAEGLAALREAGALRVPAVLGVGSGAHHAYLALEWLELTTLTRTGEAALGAQLATQHRITAPQFGWHRDNTIGATPQSNTPAADWVAFLRDRRLGRQLAYAAQRGHGGRLQQRGERLLADLDGLFGGYRPVPSLLHGDLWSGNVAADARGAPVVFDPAVYYGDREADIAMTRLFGGFGPDFYAAYAAAWPLDAGAAARTDLYNLYHVLNHLNLFGGAYLSQAESIIDRLLAQRGP